MLSLPQLHSNTKHLSSRAKPAHIAPGQAKTSRAEPSRDKPSKLILTRTLTPHLRQSSKPLTLTPTSPSPLALSPLALSLNLALNLTLTLTLTLTPLSTLGLTPLGFTQTLAMLTAECSEGPSLVNEEGMGGDAAEDRARWLHAAGYRLHHCEPLRQAGTLHWLIGVLLCQEQQCILQPQLLCHPGG